MGSRAGVSQHPRIDRFAPDGEVDPFLAWIAWSVSLLVGRLGVAGRKLDWDLEQDIARVGNKAQLLGPGALASGTSTNARPESEGQPTTGALRPEAVIGR
jgi:hypothetical protein